jgi:hypothetical protein
MNGQHGKLILQLNKAMSMLSQKIYTDVLSETDVSKDYTLFDLFRECKNELAKIDDRELLKITKLVEKELKS